MDNEQPKIWGESRLLSSDLRSSQIPETAYFHQIFNANKAIMLVIDPDTGHIIEGNLAACQFYGYDSQTLATMSIHQINMLSEEDIKVEMQQAKEHVKNHFHFQHRLASGEIREVEVYSGPIQVFGKLLLYSIVHDITPLVLAEKALRDSEQKNRQVLKNLGVAVCILQAGQFVFANDTCARWLGSSTEMLLGVGISNLNCSPAVRQALQTRYQELMEGSLMEHAWELRLQNGSKESWFLIQSSRVCWEEAPATLTVAHDITERKMMEQALRESEDRYRQLFEAESDAVFLIENATGQILEANSAAVTLYGYSRVEILVRKNSDLSAEPEETRRVTRSTPIQFEQVIHIPLRWHRKKDGTVFPVEITGRFFQWQGRGVHIAAIRDITFRCQAEEKILAQQKQLEAANARLKALAAKDPLTELFNRRAFDEQLIKEIARATRQNTLLSVILVDIDFFKTYNDSFGHPAGDEILQQLARLLEQLSRTADVVARFGGEEFVLILPRTGSQGALQLANRCRLSIEKTEWPRQALTASFGVATMNPAEGVKTSYQLITEADQALYASKNAGRNRVTHFETIEK
ncbi:MAG: sensor domain-containing diguanylate cyclase [Anaerolineales bacterium]|nr:sensor domain-containing diguanylate cyclase [Anaerolineales bacterium]